MIHRIPPGIIQNVYNLSLLGKSIRDIARSVSIAIGTVHYLLEEFETNDKDYYLLRALAVNLHKNGMDVKEYGWLVRLTNMYLDAGATREQIEYIVSDLPVYCYKARMNAETLIDNLRKFRVYLQANPADPSQCNPIVDYYQKSIEHQNKGLREGDTVPINEADKEQMLRRIIDSMMTDMQIQELNDGALVEYTKEEVVERIMGVIKNPSDYNELFFRPINSLTHPRVLQTS